MKKQQNREWLDVELDSGKESFAFIYDRYSGRLLHLAYRYMGQKILAEDVLHDAMIRIMRSIEKGNFNSEAEFYGWMKRIVINVSLNELKRKKEQLIDSNREFEKTNELNENSYVTERVQEILIELKKMPAGYRAVFNLFYIDGYKHDAIAKELEISINTSKSQLRKAKAMLQLNLLRTKEEQK